jgi:hypothetical protein
MGLHMGMVAKAGVGDRGRMRGQGPGRPKPTPARDAGHRRYVAPVPGVLRALDEEDSAILVLLDRSASVERIVAGTPVRTVGRTGASRQPRQSLYGPPSSGPVYHSRPFERYR